jgi:hypothetical protein
VVEGVEGSFLVSLSPEAGRPRGPLVKKVRSEKMGSTEKMMRGASIVMITRAEAPDEL